MQVQLRERNGVERHGCDPIRRGGPGAGRYAGVLGFISRTGGPADMTVLPIRITGDPALHAPARPVTEFDESLRTLVADMFETMDRAPGVGLAAPQVGVPLRLFVFGYEHDPAGPQRGVAINPELWLTPTPVGEPDEDVEAGGCLSVPGERFALRRAERARLSAQDLDGKPFELEASGWFARILQH